MTHIAELASRWSASRFADLCGLASHNIGPHFSHFYRDRDDLAEAVVPFILEGLQQNEQCMWVTSEPFDRASAIEALRCLVPDLGERMASGQIAVTTTEDWYRPDGVFDARRTIDGWLRLEREALEQGFTGLRVTGNTFWLESPEDFSSFAEYERLLHEGLDGHRIVALCSYCIEKLSASDLLEVVRNHHFAMIRRNRSWEIIESASLKQTKEEIAQALVDTARELADAEALQNVSSLMIQGRPGRLYDRIVETAAQLMRSDAASMQEYVPEKGQLRLVAHRGFHPLSAAHWKWVSAAEGSSCSHSMRSRERTIAGHIDEWEAKFAAHDIAELRRSGLVSVQSTPLISRGGEVIGMISTHWRKPYTPTEKEFRLFDVLARQAADLIERSQTEARLASLNEQLSHVARVHELSQVSAGIAHELNQPLTAMLNYSNLARRLISNKDEASRGKAYETIGKAGEQARRAGEIIRRMRDFVEQRKTCRMREDLNAIVKDAVALALSGAKGDNIATLLELAPHLPAVEADRVQVEQVLVNLLRNAVEAMADTPKREIRIATRVNCANTVEVSVTDTGHGISDELANRLFQPFMTTKSGGMGIGLAISRSIIQAHGGNLDTKPNPMGGAIFRFTLPAASAVQ